MKRTFRIAGLCALMALAAVSCKKSEQNKGTMTFRANIAQLNGNAKTHIGDGNMLVWNAGDSIKVYTLDKSEDNAAVFTTTADNVTAADFSGELEESEVYYAFYPVSSVSSDGDKFSLAVAAQQDYAGNDIASGTYPMWAASTDGDFNFSSHCGLLAIPMKGTATVGSIVLTDSTGMKLAGHYEMNDTDTTFVGTGNNVTLTFGSAGHTLNADAADTMYFVLPAGVFANGFTAEVRDTEGNPIKTFATSNDNVIEPKTIRIMGEVTGVNTLPTTPTYAVTTDTATLVSPSPISFTLHGSYSVSYSKDVTVGFYYGPGADMTSNVTATPGTSFSYTLDNLAKNTVYSYQAYIIEGGTEHKGAIKTFRTPDPRFTVNVDEGRQVYLASGNLQYQPSTHTWRFAENPWNFVGGLDGSNDYGNVYEGGVKCRNNDISNTYSGWIDLFGWGTKNNPTETNNNFDDDDYTLYTEVYSTTFSDWGDNIEPGMHWRTLKGDEWACMTGKTSADASRTTYGYFGGVEQVNARYAMVTLEGLTGVILFPDVYYHPAGVAVPQSFGDASTSAQTAYTQAEWNQMAANGAIFLPTQTGYRSGTAYGSGVNNSYYWTSTYYTSYKAWRVTITSTEINASHTAELLYGYSVRLARNAE